MHTVAIVSRFMVTQMDTSDPLCTFLETQNKENETYKFSLHRGYKFVRQYIWIQFFQKANDDGMHGFNVDW